MTRKSVDRGISGAEPENSSSATGLAIASVLMLPEAQQQLVTWIVRQGEVTLSEVVAYTDETEVAARSLLNDLVQSGYLQTTEVAGVTRYHRAAFAAKSGSQLAENIWQSLTPGNPLAVIRNPSGEQVVVAGSSFELYVTISNQGNQSAVIDIYIDPVSQPAYQWCLTPRDRLALGAQQSGEVVFQFQVPTQAIPGTYNYCLVVDAPQHYPEDTPIQYSQLLQVLPPVQEAVRVNDPTFALQPATSSAQPRTVQLGQPLEVGVLVHNRSDRVDRFRLTCPDLPANWFTVRYPEGLDTPGLVVEADGLALNPNAKGQILLLVHPPLDALAGTYSPTIRLHSANNPDLAMLDLVYLQILPTYLLNLELRTLLGRVRRGAGQYELRLANQGNTEREVVLQVRSADEEDLCTYTLAPPPPCLLPAKTSTVLDLRVQPTKWWRRPLYGGGRPLSFFVEAADPQQHPLPNDRLQATLIWESRPWWQFWLFVLTTLGALVAIALLLWWLFFRPPASPNILEFASEEAAYREADGDFIRLNWQIRNPEQLQAIRLTSQSPEGAATSKPLVYNFSQGIPNELKEVCVIRQLLICRGVRTDARKVGNYIFELAVIPKKGQGNPSDSQKTSLISIQPAQPNITYFRIDGKDIKADSKYLVPINPKQPIKRLVLSWQVEAGKDVKVELLPTPGTVRPKDAIAYLLTQKPTVETFTLKVTNAAGGQITRSIAIETYVPPVLPGKVAKPADSLPPAPGNLPPLVPLPALPSLPPPPSIDSPPPPGAASSPNTTPPSAATPSPNPTAPAPADPDALSPTELPPRFD